MCLAKEAKNAKLEKTFVRFADIGETITGQKW